MFEFNSIWWWWWMWNGIWKTPTIQVDNLPSKVVLEVFDRASLNQFNTLFAFNYSENKISKINKQRKLKINNNSNKILDQRMMTFKVFVSTFLLMQIVPYTECGCTSKRWFGCRSPSLSPPTVQTKSPKQSKFYLSFLFV